MDAAQQASAKRRVLSAEYRLQPCPFCEGQARIDKMLRDGYQNYQDDPDAWAYYAFCISCAAQGGWAKSPGNAVRNWHMRPTHRSALSTEHSLAVLSAGFCEAYDPAIHETGKTWEQWLTQVQCHEAAVVMGEVRE